MAYNLQPLITILEGILDPQQTRWIVDENNPQLQSLLNKATSLQQLIDKSSLIKIYSLENQIREVAHQAEDIIESHMVDQMLSGSDCARFTLPTPDLQQLTRALDSVLEQAEKLVEKEKGKKMQLELDSAAEVEDKKMLSCSSSRSKSVVVGIDADLMQLKDRLVGTRKKLEIIPIIGMGGVGKTTLARKLYYDPSIISHFDYARAWTTISQDYNMRQILLNLLWCIIGKEECDKLDNVFKDMLYKSLYGRKYLIVLDDIWSTKFWDEIRRYFPDNNNGSRIVITTRELDVANYAGSLSLHHQVQLLSKSESWNLLHQLVFGEEDCTCKLEKIGQKIASDCGGLPLAISVIGGLLSKIERSEDVWEKIGNNVIAAVAEADERCSSILSLSYNHLPTHLKPCFLYMGAFPEDYEIRGSRLVRLWVAEGFIKSNGKRSLEEEAENCLKSLIDRNLLMVRKYKKYGKPKSYSMHDLLRDLCIRKCDEEKFMYVKNGLPKVTFSNPRRMRFDILNGMKDVNVSMEFMSLTRSIICIGSKSDRLQSGVFLALRLLRVLDLMDMYLQEFPTEIFEFVNLRFLAVKCHSSIPRGISRLWNLQTLIGYCGFDVPSELWQLSELRNLKVYVFELLKDEEMNDSVMKKLQMISTTIVTKASTRDGFFKSIPNIKKLAIGDDFRSTTMEVDLSYLHKLEILTCNFIRTPDGSDYRSKVLFPCNIRKLEVNGCVINSGVMRTLCALHKLEVLTISACKFKSPEETCNAEWEVADGDEFESDEETCDEEWEVPDEDVFCSLQFLRLEHLSLVRWITDETNFPRLRRLCVDNCWYLEEIPSGIGEIPTLQLIELEYCRESVVASAKRIEEEQSENGNYDLILHITNTRL